MLKMDTTFEDFNGDQRTETHYFNMTKTEMTRLQLKHSRIVGTDAVEGGFMEFLEQVRERGSGEEMGEVVEDMILSSYGIKSDDGRKFEKDPEIRKDFSQTAAYDNLFYQLLTDKDAMEKFFNDAFNIEKYSNGTENADTPTRAYPKAPEPAVRNAGVLDVSDHPIVGGTVDVSMSKPIIVVNDPAPTDEQIAIYLQNRKNNSNGEMRG